MTRTVESPRGHTSLTITPGDDVILYLRAVNVVSEVTVPLRTADLLAAIAAECGVLVVDRADLPRVTVDRDGDYVVDGTSVPRSGTTSAGLRRRAARLLAVAEHLDAHPVVDEAQVEALAGLLMESRRQSPGDPMADRRDLARRLVARGVRVGGEVRG